MLAHLRQILEVALHVEAVLDRDLQKVDLLETRLMATKEQFDQLAQVIDAETNRLAAKIDDLVAKLGNAGMTADEEQAALSELTGVADRLRTVGADPQDPVPEEPTPEPTE